MRLGALDSLQRGFENLRANWQVIFVLWLATVLNLLLGIAALLPFYFVLDLDAPLFDAAPGAIEAWILETIEHLLAQLSEPAFWLALLSSSLVCLALLVLTSFFQAGVYGILVAGDRQAPAGRSAVPVEAFRVYSWREFQARGGRHLWSYFWLYNLMFVGWLAWVGLVVLVIAATGLVAEQAGGGAGLAIGCAAVMPLGFLLFLSIFWIVLAQVEISAHDAGPWTALRRSIGVVVRRLPAVVLLFLLFAAASVVLTVVFLMVSLPLNAGLSFLPAVRRIVGLGLQAVQWLVSAAVQVAMAAAMVALYRAEIAYRSEGVPEDEG
ncbi:MAG: hypothetical protein R3244_05660 [Thermoanaerobaculia bacterium]|nr:hypothetical protein [Thermoanaerobaculia bacterium]